MAVFINYEPTQYNVANAPILYNVTSSQYAFPQYQYVCDIRDTAGLLLTRIKQYPNPTSTATFDISRVIDDYLEWSPDNFIISGAYGLDNTDEYKEFKIYFGDEYGTSLTSNVTLYDGNGVPGDPAVSGSSFPIYAWQGTIEINNGTNWNWGDTIGTDVNAEFLTSFPLTTNTSNKDSFKKVAQSDYGILGIYDPKSEITSGMTYTLYNSSNGVVDTVSLDLTQSGSVMNYIPTGPQNLLSMGVSQGDLDSTSWYKITFDTGSNSDTIAYLIEDSCNYERTNFMFVNKFGTWDSYGITLPQRKNTNISRKEIDRPFIPWSNQTPTYNIKSRGKDYYGISTEDRYVISTQFLTDGEANYLTELLESPNVYVQKDELKLSENITKTDGPYFLPIVITNSSYVWKTNPKGQKLFQFDIEFQFSNQRYSI